MEELVKEAISITEIVKKINEVLKDSKIDGLCRKLDSLAKALDAVVNKKHHMFELHFSVTSYTYAGREYAVRLYVDGEYIYTAYAEPNTTIDAMFEKIFTSEEIKSEIVRKIHETLAELASEVASKANLVERIKEIEERLEEEDP
jgi:hypothetical protein